MSVRVLISSDCVGQDLVKIDLTEDSYDEPIIKVLFVSKHII
jgi:hypothetical protein